MAEDKKPEVEAEASAQEVGVEEATGPEGATPDFTKKHPLENRWTLWFDNPAKNQKQSSATWGQSLRSVYTFDTVEDFWCLYNNIVPPSRLGHGADFHLFKEGVEPKWEDAACASGGKWTVQVPKTANAKQLLDTYWLHTLLGMVGEQFTEGEEICGVVVSVRNKQDRVALWTKTASNEAAQISLGKEFKAMLDINDRQTIGYLAHQDAMSDNRRAKDRYTV